MKELSESPCRCFILFYRNHFDRQGILCVAATLRLLCHITGSCYHQERSVILKVVISTCLIQIIESIYKALDPNKHFSNLVKPDI